MATIDLGRLGFVNKGTYNNSTTYEKNDLVQFTDGGILSTYLYIDSTAQSGQAPSSSGTAGSRWTFFAKGVADSLASAGNNKVIVTNASGQVTPLSIGSASQALKVNSSANGFEFGTISSKILGMEKVYHSTTAVAFTNQSGTNLGANNIHAPLSLRVGGTYNKQVSNSHIRLQGWYNFHHNTTNIHGMVAYRDGYSGSIRNFNKDARDWGWYGASQGSWSLAYDVWFDGSLSAEVQGTGNMTFYVVGAVTGNRTHTHELNANGYSNSVENQTDRPNYGGFSSMIVTEYEA